MGANKAISGMGVAAVMAGMAPLRRPYVPKAKKSSRPGYLKPEERYPATPTKR